MTELRRTRKDVKPREFVQIKSMLNAGIKPAIVERATGRSWIVVHHINKASTWVEYHRMIVEYANRNKNGAGKPVVKEEKPVAEDAVMTRLTMIQLDLDKIKRRLLIVN